jgi:hypothetical protein
MMKRLTWFLGGIAAGVVGVEATKRKVRSVAHELAPVQVARKATQSARDRVEHVADALRDGRRAMKAKELELRARLDGSVTTLADELGEHDAVLVDGRPVAPGQVIVLRQARDDRARARRRA